MAYNYADCRADIFTESGQVMFLQIRDAAKRLIAEAGAVRFDAMTRKVAGDSWTLHDAVRMASAGFKSTWADFTAEGIVARPAVELQTRSGQRIIAKIKHRDFAHQAVAAE
jgi:hypothetical protein